MAKPELRDHRKFLKLRRLLGEPTPHVLGYLDCLWHRGYQTGDPIIGDALDVEAAAEYPGEPGRFAKAAHDAGFLDQDAAGLFSIHNLYRHAPTYAKKRMHRKGTAPARTAKPPNRVRADTKTPKPRTRGQKKTSEGHITENQEPRTENQEPKAENQEELKPLPPQPAAEVAARTRNEMFDAVAEVSGRNPKLNGGEIGAAAAKLKDAGFLPDEVREFGRRFWELCPWAERDNRDRPTPMEIPNHIALVRAERVARQPRSPPTGQAAARTNYAASTLENIL